VFIDCPASLLENRTTRGLLRRAGPVSVAWKWKSLNDEGESIEFRTARQMRLAVIVSIGVSDQTVLGPIGV
jgi:hypothetical protein